MTQQIGIVLVVFVAFVALIVSGKAKIHVAALMIPIALEITGVLTFSQAWSGLTNSSVITMASMFVVGAAIGKTSLLGRMSKALIKPGASDLKILMGLMVPILFLGCFISPIAVITIMIPIVTTVCAEQQKPLSKFLYPCAVITQYWAGFLPTGGNAGGYLANNTFVENLGGVGTFTYFTTMISKIPVTILGIGLAMFLTLKMTPDHGNIPTLVDAQNKTQQAQSKAKKSTMTPGKERFAVIVFGLTILGIVICALTGHSVWWPSTVAAFILVFSGVLTDREAITAMGTPTIFITVGTLPLATALNVTGADVLIADTFSKLTGGASPIVVMAAMYFICSILTQFMSNATVSNAFKSLAAIIAVQGGYDSRAMIICTTQGSASAFLAPTSAPVMTAAYDAGGYTLKDYLKMGLPQYILNFLVFILYTPLVFPLK